MSAIAKFYAGRSVFITGATGFLGKSVVEKLLRSCPELENIYLLVRAKEGEPVQRRLDGLLQNEIFEKIRATQPNLTRKLIPVQGDITSERLGISDKDLTKISDKCTVVINSAADVNLGVSLKYSYKLNIKSPMRVLDFCRTLKQCDSFVQISTSFCHPAEYRSEEKYYKPPLEPNLLLTAINTMPKEELKRKTKYLLDDRGYHNAYAYGKAIMEHLMEHEKTTFPICIVRPSSIGSTLNEPFPGWIQSEAAMSMYVLSFGSSAQRYLIGRNIFPDIIPVDLCSNSIIVAAAHNAQRENPSNVVYFNSTAYDRMILAHEWFRILTKAATKYPVPGVPFKPKFKKNIYLKDRKPDHNSIERTLYTYFFQLPVYAIYDLYYYLFHGKKPWLVKHQRKYHLCFDYFEHFARLDYYMANDKMKALHASLNEVDQKEFECIIPLDMDYKQYITNYWIGLRKFMFGVERPREVKATNNSVAKV